MYAKEKEVDTSVKEYDLIPYVYCSYHGTSNRELYYDGYKVFLSHKEFTIGRSIIDFLVTHPDHLMYNDYAHQNRNAYDERDYYYYAYYSSSEMNLRIRCKEIIYRYLPVTNEQKSYLGIAQWKTPLWIAIALVVALIFIISSSSGTGRSIANPIIFLLLIICILGVIIYCISGLWFSIKFSSLIPMRQVGGFLLIAVIIVIAIFIIASIISERKEV